MRTILVLAVLLSACGGVSEKIENDLMQTARGEVGEIILVMDSIQWGNALGDEMRNVFTAPLPGLPQDEAMFRLSKVSPRRLNTTLKNATNMIFIMTLDQKSSESKALRGYFTNQSLKKIQEDSTIYMSIRKDEFAKGQTVLFLYAQTEEMMIAKLQQNKAALQRLFETISRSQVLAKVGVQRATVIEQEIKEKHPFSVTVPMGWDQAKSEKGFVWLRQLEANSEKNLFFHYEPYSSVDVFNNVPAYRDRITEKYLRDSEDTTAYITRQMREDIKAVFLTTTSFDERYAVEARGLWKISDNSAGGPYISYTFVDETQQLIYYIEGYVYAPGGKKRSDLREVDALLSTFKPNQPK